MTDDPSTVLHYLQRPTDASILFLVVPGLGGNLLQWAAVEAAPAQHDVAVAQLLPIRPHVALASRHPLVEELAAVAAAEILQTDDDRVVVLAHSVRHADPADLLRGSGEALGDGATIETTLKKQMWGDELAQLKDGDGITWIVNTSAPQARAGRGTRRAPDGRGVSVAPGTLGP